MISMDDEDRLETRRVRAGLGVARGLTRRLSLYAKGQRL